MSKFKAGDVVVYTGKTFYLYMVPGESFTVEESVIDADDQSWWISFKGIGALSIFDESSFEHFEEWAKHQRKVDPVTELELTKHQVKMLQEWRKEALRLLEQATIDIPSHNLKQEIKNFLGEN